MSLLLAQIPRRAASAAANMADDHLLLETVPPGTLWLRFYDWSAPAFSFGIFQSLSWVRATLGSAAENVSLVRRPTGGGLVDHRSGWTYTLVAAAGHTLADGPATEAYRLVHAALAETLASLSVPALLAPCARACDTIRPAAAAPTVCFLRPETHDVILPGGGRKVAGAALRRLRQGLLLQGSVDTSGLGGMPRAEFEAGFARRLALATGARLDEAPWPFDENDQRRAELAGVYASEAWRSRR